MVRTLVSAFALISIFVSFPAAAVVSLHGGGPHATAMIVGFSLTSIVTMLFGLAVIASALFYRYRKANL